jgi:hypothetical protein
VTQNTGRVTDQCEGLAGSQEGFQQLDRVLILCQIPDRAVAAGVEDGIVVLGLDAVEANCCREPRLCICIGFEPMRKVGLEVWLVALRIQRRAPAFGRCVGDLGAGIFE